MRPLVPGSVRRWVRVVRRLFVASGALVFVGGSLWLLASGPGRPVSPSASSRAASPARAVAEAERLLAGPPTAVSLAASERLLATVPAGDPLRARADGLMRKVAAGKRSLAGTR